MAKYQFLTYYGVMSIFRISDFGRFNSNRKWKYKFSINMEINHGLCDGKRLEDMLICSTNVHLSIERTCNDNLR